MTIAARSHPARRPHGIAAHDIRGFTLIELLVVVAIIGILGMVAIPAYSDYVMRSKIPEATANLANKRSQLELFYDNNHTYAGGLAECGSTDATTSRYFTFTGACAANTYVIVADGVGEMAGFSFTIDQTNAKSTTSVPAGWTTNATCWVVRKDGSC